MAQEIIGLTQTLDLLRRMDKELLKQAQKELKKTVQPIIMDARARLPEVAASGWSRTGRVGYSRGRASRGLRAQIGRDRVPGFSGRTTILRAVQSNPGGAIFDNAGSRGNYSPPVQRGAGLVKALNKHGRAQRSLWPAALKNWGAVQRAVKQASFDMADVINEQLRMMGRGRRGRPRGSKHMR